MSAAQLEGREAPLNATICELAAQPEKYAGKMVAVRGSVTKGWTAAPKPIKEISFGGPWSSVPCTGEIVVVVFPPAVQPPPNFSLEQDDSFNRFQKALRERTHIEGTFEGRFDSAVVIRDGKRVKVGKGFGRRGRATIRLVLRKVSDLDIRPTRSVDR